MATLTGHLRDADVIMRVIPRSENANEETFNIRSGGPQRGCMKCKSELGHGRMAKLQMPKNCCIFDV